MAELFPCTRISSKKQFYYIPKFEIDLRAFITLVRIDYTQEEKNYTCLKVSCWVSEPSKMVQDSAIWEAYIVIFNTMIRVAPTGFIIFLNLQMYFQIKRILFARRNIRKSREIPAALKQARLSIVSHNYLDTRNGSAISYRNGSTFSNRDSCTISNDMMKKIINKW